MFRFFKKRSETRKSPEVRSPADLNVSVENPALVAAILAFAQSRTPGTQDARSAHF